MMQPLTDPAKNIRLFSAICFEINAKCNRACSFCPVAYNERGEDFLDEDAIVKCLDELGALGYNGRISPYLYNEPVMHKDRLWWFLRQVKKRVPKAYTMVSTNGDYFKTEQNIANVLTAGCDVLLINCYAHEKRYEQLWKMVMDLKQGLYMTVKNKPYTKPRKADVPIVWVNHKPDEDTFGGGFQLQNRSGNVPGMDVPTEPLEKMCTRPWRILNINYQGQGVLCCNDYHGVTNFGNIATHTLQEIWNNVELHKYRKALQDKNRNMPLCDTCDFNGGPYPHMIQRVEF